MPQGLKPKTFGIIAARLKPCPPKKPFMRQLLASHDELSRQSVTACNRLLRLGIELAQPYRGFERARGGPRHIGRLEKSVQQRRITNDRARVGQRALITFRQPQG